MPLTNNYKCDGQMSFFECLDAMKPKSKPKVPESFWDGAECKLDSTYPCTKEEAEKVREPELGKCPSKCCYVCKELGSCGYACNPSGNLRRKHAQATDSHEKQSNDKLQGLQTYGVLNRKIRGQRTYAYYNPNPIYTLDDGKPYVIFATVAYIGECELYVKDFMYYPKIFTYKTAKETVDAYKERVAILSEDVQSIVKQEISLQLPLQEFYKVKDEWICESRYNSMYRR